jgi:hypothetical protein
MLEKVIYQNDAYTLTFYDRVKVWKLVMYMRKALFLVSKDAFFTFMLTEYLINSCVTKELFVKKSMKDIFIQKQLYLKYSDCFNTLSESLFMSQLGASQGES